MPTSSCTTASSIWNVSARVKIRIRERVGVRVRVRFGIRIRFGIGVGVRVGVSVEVRVGVGVENEVKHNDYGGMPLHHVSRRTNVTCRVVCV